MRTNAHLAWSLAMLFAASAAVAQEPRVEDTPPRSVSEAEDPLNRLVASETVDGLVVAVTIDGTSIRLDQATPARIPRVTLTDRLGTGDLAPVTAVGYASGVRVSEAQAPDSVLRALDDWNGRGGVVRFTRREVVIALPAPRALDTVEVIAPATGARARLDVRSAYAPWCRAAPERNPMCPGPPEQPPIR
jgi:hypothetical protein